MDGWTDDGGDVIVTACVLFLCASVNKKVGDDENKWDARFRTYYIHEFA